LGERGRKRNRKPGRGGVREGKRERAFKRNLFSFITTEGLL